ncbi:MAG: SCO family protein [Gammaproteobacteria bacterium]|nr:SCO family protein [Gammaproteobacteria bacterium]MBU1656311.1 SCO family protein [Gammaproteobacteria bacterium]MBU1959876.1 SCO family protein [Gammaproteobacteria bacterium]
MTNRILVAAILLVSLFLAVILLWRPAISPDVSPLAKAPPGGGFRLNSADGPVSLGDFKGKVVLLYFGYTFCPDICPSSLALLSAALHQLSPEDQARIQPLFVSVDPERDSLEKLRQYSRYFHESFIGLTGSPEAVRGVADLYGAAYRKVLEPSSTAYTVDHSANLYLIDSQGKLAGQLPHGTAPEEIRSALQQLLHPKTKE